VSYYIEIVARAKEVLADEQGPYAEGIRELATAVVKMDEEFTTTKAQCVDHYNDWVNLYDQLATARKLIAELVQVCREWDNSDPHNHTPFGLLSEADQFLKDIDPHPTLGEGGDEGCS